MFGPRWKKVLGDLWSNKTRTMLVVMSIFIGVFAVGMITGSQAILSSELQAAYVMVNPAHATLFVSDEDSFSDDLVTTIRNMREVGEAEGRRSFSVRVEVAPNDWRDLQLTAIKDFDDIRVDKIRLLAGTWPPPDKAVLIERSGMTGLTNINAAVGADVLIELPNGRRRTMQVAGVAHDITGFPSSFSGTINGFVTLNTMEWLSGSRDYNQLRLLSAENGDSQEHNQEVAEAVYDKIQKSGREPSFPEVQQPNRHPASDFINGIVVMMGMLGVLSVFLSTFLVTNTISALLAQQVRQIGIMKAIGARSMQIIGMYMVLVLCFGLIALAVAYPLAQVATRAFTSFIAGFFNFDLTNFDTPLYVVAIQAGISLLMPVVAATIPVILGTRITVREALSTEGGAGNYGRGWIDRMIQGIRGLPRPLLLSLRNTFRRKGRVALTLLTLTLGGSIFMAIFSVRNSLTYTIDVLLDSLFNFDIELSFERDYRTNLVMSEALRVPGVEAVEAWKITSVRRILPNGNESLPIAMFAVPPETEFIKPNMTQGRWLLPGDENAVVISTGILQDDTDIKVGDQITIKLRGRNTTWQVVGVMPTIGGARWAYASQDYYERVARDVGTTSSLRVVTTERTAEFQLAVANALDQHLESVGVKVSSVQTIADLRARQASIFDFIIAAMLVMSFLIAVVGGLGLAGTMSLNVIERIREIGIMRAVGASDGVVLQIVMVEGMVIGILSWLMAASISLPMSKLLLDAVGNIIFQFPLSFSFSPTGAVVWLGLSLVLAALASFWPAWNASRVTVRDVLAYE